MFNFIRGSGRQSGSTAPEQQQQTQKMQLSPQQQIQKELNQQSFTISKRYERASSTYTNLKDKISQQGKKDIEETFKTFLLSRSTDFILERLKDSSIFSEAFVNGVLVEKARRLIENTTFTPTTQLHQLAKHASWDDIQKIIDVLVDRGNIRQAQRITKIDSKFEPLLKKYLQEKLPAKPKQPPKTSILADIKNKSSKSSTKPKQQDTTTLPRPTTIPTKSPFFRRRQQRPPFDYQVDRDDPWHA
jgi:hypothetical protein